MKIAEATIQSICSAIEFIERNLSEEISVADIADAVCYSLYHFCRMFNAVVHHTPYDYLMRRRLSETARELTGTEKKIIEIAFEYQFNSPEVFARAFKRMFGMQPNQWRKRGTIPTRSLMPRLSRQHIHYRNAHSFLKPVIEKKDAIVIAGLMTLLCNDSSVPAQLWKFFEQEIVSGGKNTRTGKWYALRLYPENWEEHGFLYLTGQEAFADEVAHPLLVIKHLPAQQYVRIFHEGCDDERFLALDYLYHTWIPKSGKQPAMRMEIDCWPGKVGEKALGASGREIFIPINSPGA